MNPLGLLFRLPFLPVEGVIRLGETLRDAAERELHDPRAARRQLEEATRAAEEGRLSPAELARVQEDVAERMVTPALGPGTARGAGAWTGGDRTWGTAPQHATGTRDGATRRPTGRPGPGGGPAPRRQPRRG